MREAVRQFFTHVLSEMAVERVFEKRPVSGIYEGKKAVDKVFDKLEESYGKVPEPKAQSAR